MCALLCYLSLFIVDYPKSAKGYNIYDLSHLLCIINWRLHFVTSKPHGSPSKSINAGVLGDFSWLFSSLVATLSRLSLLK